MKRLHTPLPADTANHLIHEKSPYLQQHVYNPVNWYPWNKEALEKARAENKPIFLSIGYSTCHWCHVMAQESFENDEVAAILNQYFVSIKVDREERPDLDSVYMTYLQTSTGSGGWPMSVWLTPDLKPFVGGTYFPPEDRWGRPGFKSILQQIAQAWASDQSGILAQSESVLQKLQRIGKDAQAPVSIDRSLLDSTFEEMEASFDPRYGGFGGAPKFPSPSGPGFLLRYHAQTGNKKALEMVLATLQKMADGGIHDQIGGGFHRYSVDERWYVPHFEKMLYDQAQLADLYLDAFQITRDQFFSDVALDILNYVRRDMTGEQGQFFSAEDADSSLPENPEKHSEGAFYVWEYDQLVSLLGPEKAKIFNIFNSVEEGGNVRSDPHAEFSKKNILMVGPSVETVAQQTDKSPQEVRKILAESRKKLFTARSNRPRPHLDDKTITAWNGLMISAFARAYQVLDRNEDLEAAVRAASFIRANLFQNETGTLLRRFRDGDAAIEGFATDYAFLIRGLLDLYEACFEAEYLSWAVDLQKMQNKLFWDESNGGYFTACETDDTVLVRLKDTFDGAEPSANSVSQLNLQRLALMTDNPEFREKAEKTLAAFSGQLEAQPRSLTYMMSALSFSLERPPQIIIVGNRQDSDTQTLFKAIHGRFLPNKILMFVEVSQNRESIFRILPFLSSLTMIDGKATAYICRNNACQLPTSDAQIMIQLISDGK